MQIAGARTLITGASSGIGEAISREVAAGGGRPVLVARGADKLEALAGELREAGAPEVEVMRCDLSDDDEIERLVSELLAGDGPPDILVNNAGAGIWRAIDETGKGYGEEAMRLPYLAAYELTRQLVPSMIERGSGWILNMTSTAAFVTIPGATAYGTARWAMRAFSYQLGEDLRGTGVGVSLLVPSEVDSPYFDNNPGSRERIPGIANLIGTMTEQDVAREAVATIERERRQWIIPWRGRWLLRTTPPPIMRALVRLTGWKRR